MKILVVSSVPTHPTTAGNRSRLLSLCDALEEAGHEVHFAWIPQDDPRCQGTPEHFANRFHPMTAAEFAPRVRSIRNLFRKVGRRLGIERSFVWNLDDWWDPGLIPQLRDLQGEHGFDCVMAVYVFYSAAFEAFGPEVLKVLETQDRFADRHKMMLASGLMPQWYSTTTEEEVRGLNRADIVIAIQDAEADAFRHLLEEGRKLVTVHPFQQVASPVKPHPGDRALVVGSSNEPNVEGVRYFLAEVEPRIRARLPDFRLVLAGSISGVFEDRSDVIHLGRVNSLEHAYSEGAVAVNPVRSGTGFCIKSLEALAFGLPLVTTRSGSRGLPEGATTALMEVPDMDPEAMAQAIVGLLQDRDRLDASARDAARFAASWNAEQLAALRSAFEMAPGSGGILP